jgi:uncharacterized protein
VKFFLYKLIAPRPSFPANITETEARLMREHAGYWKHQMEKGGVVVFGPVADPNGSYGIAVLEQPGDAEAKALAIADPAIAANVGFRFELHVMPQCVTKSHLVV